MMKVRQVEDKDIIPLAEFLAREFPYSLEKGFPYTTKEFWLSLFELWWDNNPAYIAGFPRGWLLENDATLAGFLGNIPVKFLISGEKKIAASANAWYVNSSVRGGLSLKLFNEFLKQKSPSLFLFKIEDESFISFLSRFKFRHYILPESQKEYVYIINKRKIKYICTIFFSKLLRSSDSNKVFEIFKRLGFLLCAYIYQKPLVDEGASPREEYSSSVCTSCDDSFSRLWDPYLNIRSISISRDTDTLNWLYFSSARFRKRVTIQCCRLGDNKLAGYMVFDVQRIKETDEAAMQLMDMCIGDHDPRVLDSLVSCAIEEGKQNRASLLIVWGDNPLTETYFRNTLPIRITAQHHRFIRFQDDLEMILGRENLDNVRPTMIHPPQ